MLKTCILFAFLVPCFIQPWLYFVFMHIFVFKQAIWAGWGNVWRTRLESTGWTKLETLPSTGHAMEGIKVKDLVIKICWDFLYDTDFALSEIKKPSSNEHCIFILCTVIWLGSAWMWFHKCCIMTHFCQEKQELGLWKCSSLFVLLHCSSMIVKHAFH